MKSVTSAGGILLNLDKTKLYAIHQIDRDEWALPKGTPHTNEQLLDTAYREISEETGFISFLVIDETKQFVTKYTFTENNEEFDKTVTYFIFQIQNDAQKETPEMHKERLEGKWVTPEEFLKLVEGTKTNDLVDVIKKAHEYFRHV